MSAKTLQTVCAQNNLKTVRWRDRKAIRRESRPTLRKKPEEITIKVSDNASEITNLFGIVFKRAERNKTTNVKRSAATAKTTSKKGTFELNME